MIEPADWYAQIETLARAGANFRALYAADGHDGGGSGRRRVTAVLEHRGRLLARACTTADGKVPSLLKIFPAAEWDEREAHDLYGVEFAGHEPLRPLIEHIPEPRRWMSQVNGAQVHQVAVGPIHAGVIESGHFRFHVVGERILGLDLRLFYKHRGIERLAEGLDEEGSLALAARVCAGSSAAIQVALAQCWERYHGLDTGPELVRARTLLIELERLYNHLNDLGAICAGVGYSPGAMAFASLKERVQRLNLRLVGHRFLFDSIAVGRSSLELDRAESAAIRGEIESVRADAASFWREILFSATVQERFRGTGMVSAESAARLGLVGPAARACGLGCDRRCRPDTGLAYAEDFRPARLEGRGDVAARSEIRALEIEASCLIVGRLLEAPLAPTETSEVMGPGAHGGRPDGPFLASVEGPRGEIVVALEVVNGRVGRLHLRSASFANWPALREAVIGDILPDFPLINKSFELSYAAVDR